jgi:hypothetical protein
MQWDDEGGFEGPDGGEGGLNQFFMMAPSGDGPDGVPDGDGRGPMDGGAKAFFFSAVPPMGGDRGDGPLSDDEMFAGFRGGFGSDGPDGSGPPMDLDDDAWLPPMGDDGPADRDEMFKAFGFEDDEGVRPPGGDDDGHRGFMSFDEEGDDRPEGGLNNFFMAGPEGDRDEGAPVAVGAKDFFFAGAETATDDQESEPTRQAQPEPAQQSTQAPPPSFFNPTESAPTAEEETQPSAFFKAPATPSSVNEENPKGAFFANPAASTTSNAATTRQSFFNPGGGGN